MPYSINSYQDAGGSPFQQYQNQQQQNQLQQQQAQNQNLYLQYLNNQQGNQGQQGQQNPTQQGFNGQQGGFGGQQGFQYNPLPTYNTGQNNTGFQLGGGVPPGTPQSGFTGINTQPPPNLNNNWTGQGPNPNNPNDPRWWPSGKVGVASPQGNPLSPQSAAGAFQPTQAPTTPTSSNPYSTYQPFQPYGMFGSPSGGTGTYDFSSMFNYQ